MAERHLFFILAYCMLAMAVCDKNSGNLSYTQISPTSISLHNNTMDRPRNSRNQERILHRHKRYLLFPEGSSFQLVFDLIIPIVDYTNFAIMGITCAVAWELPSKPPSEIIDHLQTKLNDGTFGLSRRNDTAPQTHKFVEGEWPNNRPFAYNIPYLTFQQQSAPNTGAQHKMSEQQSVGENPSAQWSSMPSSTKWNKKNWWDHNKERVENEWHQKQWKWQAQTAAWRTTDNRRLLKFPTHRIHTVFTRRKRQSSNSVHDKVARELHGAHVNQHLETRTALFSKIEKVYKSRGYNGTACVLRSLCETQFDRWQRNQEPGSFVTELLRTIYSLPPNALSQTASRSSYLVAAYYGSRGYSCSHRYPDCDFPPTRR